MRHKFSRLIILAIMALTLTSCTSVMGTRFSEGLMAVISSPLQVRDNVREEMPKAQIAPIGAVGGSMKGSFYMIKQIVTGLMQAATFFNTK